MIRLYLSVLVLIALCVPAGAQYLEIEKSAVQPDQVQPMSTLKLRAPANGDDEVVKDTGNDESQSVKRTPPVVDTPEGVAIWVYSVEEQLASMLEENERLTQQLAEIQKKFDLMSSDNAVRFKDLESKLAAGETEATGNNTQKADGEEKPKADAKSKPAEKAGVKAAGKAAEEKPKPETAQQLYDRAYKAIEAKKFADAEKLFAEFLKKYPKSQLTSNAQYWYAESFYVRGQFQRAATEFAVGFKNHKNSAKGPDNLIKLGLSMVNMKKNEEACAAFTNFESEFPKASQQLKKRAKDEAAKIKC